jgi:SNF2 family DNA or RNA helicase
MVPTAQLVDGGVRLRLRVTDTKKSRKTDGVAHFGINDLLNYEWQVSMGDEAMSVQDFEALAQLKSPLVQVRGQWVLLDQRQIERTLQTMNKFQSQPMDLQQALQLAGGMTEDAPDVEVEWSGSLAALAGSAALEPQAPPAGFHGQLRPYQARGWSWLAFLRQRGLGATLADDMGLGKTVQTICLLLACRAAGPSLLVCPTSVVGNWERELRKFSPELRATIHHGAQRSRELPDSDLIITSYGLLARDLELLAAPSWNVVVLDEAQNIKNPDTRQARAARSLRARFKLALTGTPVENRLTDLWSIFEFTQPGLLGKHEKFKRHFAAPIERYGNVERREQLRRLTQPFLLRRVKTDPTIISDLPEKNEMKVYCPLTREQATIYQAVVDDAMARIKEADGVARKGLVLSLMLRLKQVCNHPAQFLGDGSALESRSGKLERLEEMLAEVVEARDRALVFTQFTELGERLAPYLRDRLGVEVLYLHGGTARKQRDAMVERFQASDSSMIFVLSLKAGGVGLNLTGASHVFHFDRWWNPAVENQATDRAFRIGQKRNVQVHKMICQGTLEETVDQIIERKQSLAESIVGSGEAWLTELSDEQLRDLVKLRPDAVEAEAGEPPGDRLPTAKRAGRPRKAVS